MKYIEKPVEVDVRQFTGGEENGKELEAWVNSHGGSAKWTPEIVFDDLTVPEEFSLKQDKRHIEWNLIKGWWVVYHNNFFYIHSNEQFHKLYQKAE